MISGGNSHLISEYSEIHYDLAAGNYQNSKIRLIGTDIPYSVKGPT